MSQIRLVAFKLTAAGICLAGCSLFLLTGCHGSSAGPSQASGSSAAPFAIVAGPKLTKDSLKGGPMPASAAAIYREKMAQVAQQSIASHSKASAAGH